MSSRSLHISKITIRSRTPGFARCARALVVLSLALAPAAARAAQPGVARGTLMVSAERLFGLSAIHTSQDIPGGEINVDEQAFGLAIAPTLGSSYVYRVPRVGFDFALTDGLTLGGALGIATGDSGADTTTTEFLLAPRVGYALGLSKLVGIWLRGGFSYFNVSRRTDDPDTTGRVWGMSLNLEPALMLSPVEHVSFTASLILDLPMAGRLSTEVTTGNITRTTSVGFLVRNIGLVGGMVVSF